MSAYLAYICAVQGHVRNAVSTTTNETAYMVWASHCSRCGAEL